MSFDNKSLQIVQPSPANPGETQVLVTQEKIVALVYRGGPIVIIGLDDTGQVQVVSGTEPPVSIDNGVIERIRPYLEDSVLLCEYFLDELYVWGVVDMRNELITSMLATEMAAEALQLRASDQIKAYKRVYEMDAPDMPETRLSQAIFRPEKAFPLNDLGDRVSMKFLLSP